MVPSTWVKSLGVPLWSRHLERAEELAHIEHTHCGVSTRPSKELPLAPSASEGWKSPREWPLSWAAVSAMTSGPQLRLKLPLHPPLRRSAVETTAPPATVP